MKLFRGWAGAAGLVPSETAYVARTRDRRKLQFSKSGDAGIETAYRTHWVSPALSEKKRQRLTEHQSKAPDLVVVMPLKEFTCTSCGGSGSLLIMEGTGPFCLTCADMNHLVFLPSGNAALTRRATKASRLSAVVVRFSRSRKHYERQGILVEEAARERAERECLDDSEVRARRQERDAARRAEEDHGFLAALAAEIDRRYPGCPPDRAELIARHAGARGSGRVGRSAAGRALDPGAVDLMVVASVRHEDTDYDQLLMSGVTRQDARQQVRASVQSTLQTWQAPPAP
jgi:hypothetical protein